MASILFKSLMSWATIFLFIIVGMESLLHPESNSTTPDPLSWEGHEQVEIGKQTGNIDIRAVMNLGDKSEKGIINMTSNFAQNLRKCERIVSAAYQVADYVPRRANENQRKLWEKDIIPLLAKTLKQDVVARSLITKSIGSVRNLAIVIKNIYEILIQTRGSEDGIATARKFIPEALDQLDKYIQLAERLDGNAIEQFGNHTEEIFHITGHKGIQSFKDLEKLDEMILKHRNQQQLLISKYGEVEKFFYLIQVSMKQIDGTEEELKAAKERTNEHNKILDNFENTILNISKNIKENVIESRSFGWHFWGITWTETRTLEADEKKRDSEQKFFDKIVSSRMRRLMDDKQDEIAKKKAIKEMENDLAEYKLAYNKAKEELKILQASLNKDLNDKELEIKRLMARKRELEEIERKTFEDIGLEGGTLISCLKQVRIFARSLEPGASAYSPLATILTNIKELVQTQVFLLSYKNKPKNVFDAVTLLIKRVKFLSEYTLDAQQIVKTSDDYLKGIE